jgi:deoxyhypusine synthase
LGIDFALHKIARQDEGRPVLRFDPFEDFEKFASTMLSTKRMGIFTIGGGVPRNWSQQFGVYAELLARRGYRKLPLKRYNYGVRICPEPVHWGGLSGSTYTEAVSWGKFVPPEEGGRFAEVFDDATVALPLVVGAVLERIGYFKSKADDQLKSANGNQARASLEQRKIARRAAAAAKISRLHR